MSNGRHAFVLDRDGERVAYDFSQFKSQRPKLKWWTFYEQVRDLVRAVTRLDQTQPAYASSCKLCHWYRACKDKLIAQDDLTLVAGLGRARREVLQTEFASVQVLADANIDGYIDAKGRTPFFRIGESTLVQFKERADLQKAKNPQPYLKRPWTPPAHTTGLYFDIEDDPMRGFLYLHGFWVVDAANPDGYYRAFITDDVTPDEERRVFAEALTFIRTKQPAALYYYSAAEKTAYRRLARTYPDVASEDEINAMFDASAGAVDLYQVVTAHSVWTTYDLGLKTLATFADFQWRDSDPSGAASIEWFDRWMKGETDYRQRILDYNEDDCRATLVLREYLEKM